MDEHKRHVSEAKQKPVNMSKSCAVASGNFLCLVKQNFFTQLVIDETLNRKKLG